MSEIRETKRDSSVVAKAGLWYTICNFAFKGMAFITTPIFARLLTKQELGNFSNFASWAVILLTITSLDLAQSIIRSKFEHDQDMDSYIWSILSFSTLWTLFLYGVFLLFPAFFSSLLSIDIPYIHIMFCYLFTAPAYTMLITKHRAYYKYKLFVLLTGLMALSGIVLSLILVSVMSNRLTGRIIGYYLPYLLIGLACFILIAIRGKRIRLSYWKYAIAICLPLVPHILSMNLLSLSDTLIIRKLSGAEYAAVYSIAYNAYHITTILFDSMNKAWAPWLLESLHNQHYSEIKRVSKVYIGVFVGLCMGVLLLVPEIVLVLGGKTYLDAIYCLPPLIASCIFQFFYTMYVNIEFYLKKTVWVSVATLIATAVNIGLNLIFIPMNPEKSFIIASFTTLAGYMILFVLHYLIVKRMKMTHIYDTKLFVFVLVGVLAITATAYFLYQASAVRFIVLVLYLGAVIYLALKNKQRIMLLIKRKSE